MNEYRVKVTVRNNLLLSAIEAAGYKSCAVFAREIGYHSSAVNELTSMRQTPINENGDFSPLAKTIMEALGAAPSDLWTIEQLNLRLRRNSSERNVGQDEVDYLLGQPSSMMLPNPADEYQKKQASEVLKNVVGTLTEREQQVLSMHHEQEMTLDEIGDAFGISRERIRQIEARALRKLRHPDKAKKIKEAYDINFVHR
jgi:RNA polymerase primary sigma factor